MLIEDKQLDRQFSHWYAVDCIFTNVSVVIENVIVENYQPIELALSRLVDTNPVTDDDDDDSMEGLVAVMSTEAG